MPTYAAPGVYVEEVPSSQKVLTAAATAIAAFVGFTGRPRTMTLPTPMVSSLVWSRAGPSLKTFTAALPRVACCLSQYVVTSTMAAQSLT